jgi:hypothetical protein
MIRTATALALLVACSHPRPGVRNGTSTDHDDPALADLSMGANADQDVSRPLTVTVWLGRDSAPCFTATSDYHVTIDGNPAVLTSPGGAARPFHASGLAWQLSACSPAMFTSAPAPGTPPPGESHIVIEHAGGRAEMTIAHLLTVRTLQVQPGTTVHPGEHVTLTWTPADDEWSGYAASTYVFLYEPNDVGVDAQVTARAPEFHFTVPAVRPGKLRLDLKHPYLDEHPKIRSCTGVAQCESQVHNGPREIELLVQP